MTRFNRPRLSGSRTTTAVESEDDFEAGTAETDGSDGAGGAGGTAAASEGCGSG